MNNKAEELEQETIELLNEERFEHVSSIVLARELITLIGNAKLDECITEFHEQRIMGLSVTSPTRHHNVNSQIDWAIKAIDNLRGTSDEGTKHLDDMKLEGI